MKKYFTLYEKIWFVSIFVLSIIVAIFFPEEDVNGFKGYIITLLYLIDTFLNILCELLIAKQSRWNFIISLGVEATEIIICIILAYRFATLATTLLFWIPIDIISFITWSSHIDKKDKRKTEVRKLTLLHRIILTIGIIFWTLIVGYVLTMIDTGTDFFHGDKTLENIICYLDSCASALAISNGIFIYLRYEEQWIMWIATSIVECIINIISGQAVLIVLKLGYLTNSIYGLINWNKYIKNQ